MKKTEVLFWAQFILVVVSSTHQLSKWFFGVPVLIGCIVAVNLMVTKNIRWNKVTIFFLIMIFGYLFRSISIGELLTLDFAQGVLLIISGYGLVTVFQELRISNTGYYFANTLLLFAVLFSLAARFVGFSQAEAIGLVFLNSSYHLVAWIFLLLLGVLESHRTKVGLLPYLLFALLCVSLEGRTGVVVSLFLLAFKSFGLYHGNRVMHYAFISGCTLVVYSVITYFDYTALAGDLGGRGLLLGPREFIWLCYIDNISVSSFILGFNPSSLQWCTAPYIKGISLESSLFSLNYNFGIFAVPLLYLVLRRLPSAYKEKKILLGIFLALIFRVGTGEFIFIGPFDWIFLAIFFSDYQKTPRSFNPNRHSLV